MRQVLRLLGTRYGVALALVVGIGLVVLVGRALGGSTTPPPITGGADSPAPTATVSAEDDDGVTSPDAPIGPSTSPGAATPDVVARNFTTAWLKHDNVTAEGWYAGLKKYMTANLAEELNGVDPAGVPAARMTGPPALIDHDAAFVEATIPVDSGVVTLRLLATNGRWLVDGVDWTRG